MRKRKALGGRVITAHKGCWGNPIRNLHFLVTLGLLPRGMNSWEGLVSVQGLDRSLGHTKWMPRQQYHSLDTLLSKTKTWVYLVPSTFWFLYVLSYWGYVFQLPHGGTASNSLPTNLFRCEYCILRGYETIYYSSNDAFWGEQSRYPKWTRIVWVKLREAGSSGFYCG